MRITLSLFGDEVTGGSEVLWRLFRERLGFENITYANARDAMGYIEFEGLRIPDLEAAFLMTDYIKRVEKYGNLEVIIKNSRQLPAYKPDAKTICLVQDCHRHAAGLLKKFYNTTQFNDVYNINDEMQRASASTSDEVVYVSEFCKKVFEQEHPEFDGRVIEHGIDRDIFKPMDKKALRAKYNIPSDRPVGIWVGRYHPQKGWGVMTNLLLDRDDIFWIMCMMGNHHTISQNPKNSKMFYNMSRSTMVEMYNMADFFVLPSYCESFGLASLEAATCGLPILTNNTGWVYSEDGKRHEEYGIVLDGLHPTEYSKGIDELLNGWSGDPRKATERFNRERWVKEWESVINE